MHNTMTATATLPVIPEGETKEDTSRPGNVTIGLEDANVGQADSFETPMDRRPSLIKGHSRWGVTRPHLLRESSTTVLQGGKEVLVEEVTNTRNAMDPVQRRASQFLGRYSTNQDEEDIETGAHKQYRLTSRRTEEKWNLWQNITGIGPDGEGYDLYNAAGMDYLTMYLRWTFRTSFFLLLLSSFLAFWGLCCFFAALIYAAAMHQPQCLSVGGKNFTDSGEHFKDAYALSWHTLSTVGYGSIYPQLPTDDGTMCLGINLFCTVEAFVGVLFAGFMAAIIFGKVARIQSFATVDFSDPIVVRFGTEVMDDDGDDVQSEPNAEKGVSNVKPCPFPILEFRCLNRMHSERGGEILDATVNVVAAVLASEASASVRYAVSPSAHRNGNRFMPKQVTDRGKAGFTFVTNTAQKVGTAAGKVVPKQVTVIGKAGGRLVTGTAEKVGTVAGKAVPKPIEAMGKEFGGLVAGTAQKMGAVAGKAVTAAGQVTGMFETTKAYDPDEPSPSVRTLLIPDGNPSDHALGATDMYAVSISEAHREHQVLDEGSDLVPQRIFCNLEVDSPAHPLFKRVWYFRHTLDQNSPLLSQEAKQLIAESNGFWPEELNNYQAIRRNLHFHEIIVNVSGTGNATGSSVYAQKVYSFGDVIVGYTFVSTLFRRSDGRISVDNHLLNDVVEQNGGGGEPFGSVRVGHPSDVVDQVFKKTNDVRREAQDMVVSTTEKMHDMAKDVVLQTTDMVTEAGAQFTYEKKDA